MNIDDQGTQQEEFMRDIALKVRKPELAKTGFCLECEVPVRALASFCCCECRWTTERRIENAKGK